MQRGEAREGAGLFGPVLITVAAAQGLGDLTLFVPTLVSPPHDTSDLGRGLFLDRFPAPPHP